MNARRAIVCLVTVLGAFALILVGHGVPATGSEGRAGLKTVREAAVAGMFYPASPDTLRQTVTDSLNAARKEQFDRPIKALLVPHAGYLYCGRSLAAAYKQIEQSSFPYDTVVLIGPSHRVRTRAAALSSAQFWQTPLGRVPVDQKLSRQFVERSDRIEFNDRAHAQEHSLEVQLPYLIVASGGKPFKIVPILTNSSDPTDHEILARALAELASNPRTLIVISTDLSHYPSAKTAEEVDKAMLDAVTSLSAQTVMDENRKLMRKAYPGLSVTMCGLEAVLCVERAAKSLGINGARVVSRTNSGMVSHDNQRVVGYGAVVFTGSPGNKPRAAAEPRKISFSEESTKELVSMARSAVKSAVDGSWVKYDPSDNPELQVRAGCFVTLKNNGKLRGCIGRFTSEDPLWRLVREMAVSSATRDYRFAGNPIKPSEVPDLDVEISVLSPPHRVTDPLKEIELGRDGIIVRDKGRSGTFLPQVATETGWNLEEFLGHCARDKAGLTWDGWKSPTAKVFTYTATIVHEGK
ncbi:MAG: AmmeMemoRadiSam system protein B [Deltaproteobacteria bacterium]